MNRTKSKWGTIDGSCWCEVGDFSVEITLSTEDAKWDWDIRDYDSCHIQGGRCDTVEEARGEVEQFFRDFVSPINKWLDRT